MLKDLRKWYRNNPNKNLIKAAIFVAIALILMLVTNVLTASRGITSKPVVREENQEFTNITELCEHYGVDFYSRGPSDDEDYFYDIAVSFHKGLENEDGTSNEEFFMAMIKAINPIINYVSYRFVDNSQNLIIAVKMEDKKIALITVNGVENYFEVNAEIAALKDYVEIPETELVPESFELVGLEMYKWNASSILDTDFVWYKGTKQYFEKGYITKERDDKVLSIVFTNRYTKPVLNGIMVDSDMDYKRAALGKPAFADEDNEIIGYKGKTFYAFLTKDTIAIYRRVEDDYDLFINLANSLVKKEITLNQFVDKLTDIWADYDTYELGTDHLLLTYPQRGVAVKFNYDNRDSIIFYNNCKLDESKMKELTNSSGNFLLQRKIDLTDEVATKYLKESKEEIEKCKEFVEKNKTELNPLVNSIYGVYADYDANNRILKLYFVSKDGKNPNRELMDNVDTFAWLNDDVFLYSVENKGIYYCNLKTGKNGTVKLGTDYFKIVNCLNGLLSYDNKKIIVEQSD